MVSGPGSYSLMFICQKCLAVVQKTLGFLLKDAFNIAKEVISGTLTLEWFLCLKLTIPLLQKKKKTFTFVNNGTTVVHPYKN